MEITILAVSSTTAIYICDDRVNGGKKWQPTKRQESRRPQYYAAVLNGSRYRPLNVVAYTHSRIYV